MHSLNHTLVLLSVIVVITMKGEIINATVLQAFQEFLYRPMCCRKKQKIHACPESEIHTWTRFHRKLIRSCPAKSQRRRVAMQKVFISLPMEGKTRSEILNEQAKILARVNEKLAEPVMLIESYFDEKHNPLECFGENLKRMSHADYAVFAKGWQYEKDCVIEYMCAEKYGIKTLEL